MSTSGKEATRPIARDFEQLSKQHILRIVSYMAAPFLFYYMVTDLRSKQYVMGIMLAVAVTIITGFLLCSFLIRDTKKQHLFHSRALMLFSLLLGLMWVFTIGIEGRLSRLPFSFLIPILLFFSFGEQTGLFISLALYVGILCIHLIFDPIGPVDTRALGVCYYVSFPLLITVAYFITRIHKIYRKRIEESESTLRKTVETLRGEATKRQETESVIKASEMKYKTLFDSVMVGLYRSRVSDGKLLEANRAFADMLGYDSVEELLAHGNAKSHYEDINFRQTLLKELSTHGRADGFEIAARKKDGSPIQVMVSATHYPEQDYIEGFMLDISEKKKSEEEREALAAQLEYAKKMEALGTLAGGVAHNFNNLLMGIQGYASLALMESKEQQPNYEKLKMIEKLVSDGAALTKQLLGYTRTGMYEMTLHDLNVLATGVASTFSVTRKEIDIEYRFAEIPLGVVVDRSQIEQALLNLFINAADAMPGGGTLRIRSFATDDSRMTGKQFKLKKGKYALLEVEDTGEGMEPGVLEKVFDPFFTTKDVGKGTGLGLASVYGIVKGHQGYIDVNSIRGKGTKFSIYLPLSAKMIQQPEEVKPVLPACEGTLLLVDDEETVLEVGRKMLKNLGYTVYPASGGKEAVDIYKKKQQEIDLVILDLVMPLMSGSETFERLREMDPGVKILLTSGYSSEGKAKILLEKGCNGFIQKPFDIEELSEKTAAAIHKSW